VCCRAHPEITTSRSSSACSMALPTAGRAPNGARPRCGWRRTRRCGLPAHGQLILEVNPRWPGPKCACSHRLPRSPSWAASASADEIEPRPGGEVRSQRLGMRPPAIIRLNRALLAPPEA
jgi:hypothetical protein